MVFNEFTPGEWKPEKDGDSVQGVLIQKQKDVGTNNAMLYGIEKSDGKVVNVWGSTILDSRLSLIKEGTLIRITYKGLGEASAGKHAPKIFKVEIDDGKAE